MSDKNGKEDEVKRLPKPTYTTEFRVPTADVMAEAMKIAEELNVVAQIDCMILEQTLRNWVKAFDAGKLNEPGTRAVTPEQMELSRLRVENLRLQRQCEILKKAAAYFATDAL